MQIKKLRDDAGRAERLATEGEKESLFDALATGRDATEWVETSRGRFEVKYPKPADLMEIGRVQAARRGWKPAEAFSQQFEEQNLVASTLDVLVVDGDAAWFKKAKSQNPDWSFKEAPDQKFLAELFGKAYEFRLSVEKTLGEGGESGSVGIPAAKGSDEAVGGGVFEGVSKQRGDAKP